MRLYQTAVIGVMIAADNQVIGEEGHCLLQLFYYLRRLFVWYVYPVKKYLLASRDNIIADYNHVYIVMCYVTCQ